MATENTSGVSAYAEELRMSEGYEPTDANRQFERQGGNGEDHHPLANNEQVVATKNRMSKRHKGGKQHGGNALLERRATKRGRSKVADAPNHFDH
jgi:hypothetical protein